MVGGNLTLLEGKDIVFRCPVVGSPKPVVKWYFKDQLIVPSDTTRIDPKKGTLKLIEITEEEDGLYSCVATNLAGQDKEISFVLTVGKYVQSFINSFLTRSVSMSCHSLILCVPKFTVFNLSIE